MTSDSSAGAPHVRFDAVSKSYDGKTSAVSGLSLDVAHGEFLTLLGPSGSGKTTSLMMLAGFETPTSGDIFLDGTPVTRIAPHLRGIGMVFQNYALFPHMTVAQNLAFPLSVRGKPKAEIAAKVERALSMVRLTGFGARKPAQLSGGQQQRIALARALAFEPRLVLMDEPLGALDKALREEMQYEIKRIHNDLGVTVVYVTHDQSEALTLSDRIAVFDNGKVAQCAPPAEIYDRPSGLFVAGFVGENNFLTATAEVSGAMAQAQHAGGRLKAKLRTSLKGARATFAVRPERVCLSPPGGDGWARLSGTVRERYFAGDHLRLVVELPGGEDVVAKLPRAEAASAPAPGARATIGWRHEDASVFEAA